MIHYVTGSIFDSKAEALVNPVNTRGASGAGLHKQFAKWFPEEENHYKEACRAGVFKIGYIATSKISSEKYICFFPTKDDWRSPSKIEYITKGLKTLIIHLINHDIKSVAIPPLGCGLGGLKWPDVKKEIEDIFQYYPEITVYLYTPGSF